MVTSQDVLRTCKPQQIRQPVGLGSGEFPPGCREVIVTAAFMPRFVLCVTVNLFNETFFKQRLNRAIECARPQPHSALGLFLDAPHDRIAVQILISDREQNVEGGGRKWVESLLRHDRASVYRRSLQSAISLVLPTGGCARSAGKDRTLLRRYSGFIRHTVGSYISREKAA